jgi:hypothetical protein
MKKLYTLLGIVAIGAVIGLTVLGCDTGSSSSGGGGGDNGTLVITGVPEGSSVSSTLIVIVPAGTATTESALGNALVAGADGSKGHLSLSGTTLTVKIYVKGTNDRWTGSGTYDVYTHASGTYSRATGEAFSNGSATIPSSKFSSVTVTSGGG